MGYLHISNLYRPEGQTILLFKECYALEKIHGTSAHLTFKTNPSNPDQRQLTFFSGGTKYETFVALFDKDKLMVALKEMGIPSDRDVSIYGESYGGKEQGMSHTYGPIAKFIVFDVQIGERWLSVPEAEKVAQNLGLEFVDYVKVSTDLVALDAERDKPSEQAIRNGMSFLLPAGDEKELTTPNPCWYKGRVLINPKPREGVVLRPLIELTLNNDDRVICKHKGDAFKETATPRPVVDPSKLKVLEDANAVATEWCTATRLEHVLDKLPGHGMEKMREIISAMTEDVLREGKGEIVESEAAKKAIGKKTVEIYKNYLKSQIKQ